MAFEPTHVVPQDGVQAWSTPDGSQPPAANLGAGTELRVVEEQGQWTHVEASNGWRGWVDGSRLAQRQPAGAPPPPPGSPAPPSPPGAAPAPTMPGVTGELGKPRSIGISILLAIVTLGIYAFVWTYKTHKEIKTHSGLGVGGPIGLVIYILIGIVTPFLIASEVRQMYQQTGWEAPVQGITGLWILLPIVGPFVWFFKVQGALNDLWVAKGAPRP